MDDLTTYALLATSFFFVALAFGLLVRYRQVSQKINSSTEMGRDLWGALEQRLRKQDERILDMMGRLEVVQSRVIAATQVHAPASLSPLPPLSPPAAPAEEKPTPVTRPGPTPQQPESQESQQSQAPASPAKIGLEMDETQLAALKLLGESPKDTRQLTDTLKKSREHTARMMKELFEMGLVRRNDSAKPFVYQLTDEGRRRLG
ncbi:MAG: winged helix DNA-binding protein [Thaumarchaeota archaeon]|nr:winged helix DNA-binding protein [Nitrososphaerota archaeon]